MELKDPTNARGNGVYYDVGKAWEREVHANQEFKPAKNGKIMPMIAFFERDLRYYCVFPWPDRGNLQDYWKHISRRGRYRNDSQHSLFLAHLDPLKTLVGCLVKLDAINMYHGDLKPENILLRKDHRAGLGTFRLAKSGLAEISVSDSEMWIRTATGRTAMAYQPPEAVAYHLHKDENRLPRVSPQFLGKDPYHDVWSMGCIIFDYLICLLCGNEDLEGFHNATILNDSRMDPRSIAFETPYYTLDLKGTAKLKKGVIEWYGELIHVLESLETRHPEFMELLYLVMTELLVIARPERPLTKEVNQEEFMTGLAQYPDPGMTGKRFPGRAFGTSEMPSESPALSRADAKTVYHKLEDFFARVKWGGRVPISVLRQALHKVKQDYEKASS